MIDRDEFDRVQIDDLFHRFHQTEAENRVPRPCRDVLCRDWAGILTLIAGTMDVNFPTLSHKTRQGWGTLFLFAKS